MTQDLQRRKYDQPEHTSWFFNAQYSYRCNNIKAIYWLLTWNQPNQTQYRNLNWSKWKSNYQQMIERKGNRNEKR